MARGGCAWWEKGRSCSVSPVYAVATPAMSRIYVGNLPADVRSEELDRLFDRFGA